MNLSNLTMSVELETESLEELNARIEEITKTVEKLNAQLDELNNKEIEIGITVESYRK